MDPKNRTRWLINADINIFIWSVVWFGGYDNCYVFTYTLEGVRLEMTLLEILSESKIESEWSVYFLKWIKAQNENIRKSNKE